jgi:hypothetical protein
MLARLDNLQAGDALLCVADLDGTALPPRRRRQSGDRLTVTEP